MRFYNTNHQHYCGIDLHARNMYTCVLDQEGKVLLHRDLPTEPDVFLKAIAPFRNGLAVAVECIFTWYCTCPCLFTSQPPRPVNPTPRFRLVMPGFFEKSGK